MYLLLVLLFLEKKKSSENTKKKKKKKKKALKMTSKLVSFRAFLFIFFVPPTLNRKKNSHKSTNKKILALGLKLGGDWREIVSLIPLTSFFS